MAVIVAAAAIAAATVVLLGGPRLGYLPGIVFSAVVSLIILWRYPLRIHTRWFVAALLTAYYAGGALMVGDDVFAHISVGYGTLRYDRGIHVLGAMIAVLMVADIAKERHPMSGVLVVVIAAAAGFAVEGVELATALGLPSVFSFDLVDSSLDVAGNTVGLALGLVALYWAEHRPIARYRTAGSV